MSLVKLTTAPTMTLKEITDLLNVRHDKAMAKVTEMAKEAEFGACVKIGHMVDIGSGAQRCIQTYALDKRQSIAVASKLNTALLMRIIDRWQELEAQVQSQPTAPVLPQSYLEALECLVVAEKEKIALTHQVEEMQPTVAAYERLTYADGP